jgi:hypothetical protein
MLIVKFPLRNNYGNISTEDRELVGVQSTPFTYTQQVIQHGQEAWAPLEALLANAHPIS